jgi:hypothetical protein
MPDQSNDWVVLKRMLKAFVHKDIEGWKTDYQRGGHLNRPREGFKDKSQIWVIRRQIMAIENGERRHNVVSVSINSNVNYQLRTSLRLKKTSLKTYLI